MGPRGPTVRVLAVRQGGGCRYGGTPSQAGSPSSKLGASEVPVSRKLLPAPVASSSLHRRLGVRLTCCQHLHF
jgi:hypothetical protein